MDEEFIRFMTRVIVDFANFASIFALRSERIVGGLYKHHVKAQ